MYGCLFPIAILSAALLLLFFAFSENIFEKLSSDVHSYKQVTAAILINELTISLTKLIELSTNLMLCMDVPIILTGSIFFILTVAIVAYLYWTVNTLYGK